MTITSALSNKCCKIIDEYENQLCKEFNNTCKEGAGNSSKLCNCNKLRNRNRFDTNLVNSIVASESPYRRDSSLIWLSFDPNYKGSLNNDSYTQNEDDFDSELCEKYVLVDTYTSILASNRQQACYISLLNPLPQDTVVGVKFGEHLCEGRVKDTIIEYISPSLPVGRQYARIYINSVKMGVKFGNGNTMSEERSYLPFDVIIQEPKSRRLIFKKNKTAVPVGVMGQPPLPEVDIEDEVEELMIMHKPRADASVISRRHALDKYFKSIHSKVVNAPRRETGDLKNLDPAYRAAVNRDFIRRLSNIALEPECRRTVNLLNEFISKLDIGTTGNIIPFNVKLKFWNRVIADGCQEVIDNYHSYVSQVTSNETAVYIFTRTSPEALNPLHVFLFSCVLNEESDETLPILRRFVCMPNDCGDVRLWACIGDCDLSKNEMANIFRKIQLPCPIPPIMKTLKSAHVWSRAKNQSKYITLNNKLVKDSINSELTQGLGGGPIGAAGIGVGGFGAGIPITNDIVLEDDEVAEKDRCIKIASNVFLYFELWPSKLLPNPGNTTESYSFTICINNHQYHSVTGISKPVLSFILQKWLTRVPLNA
ncbi:hypothetical protein HWI79_2020 [Cryptosporidium felis]|nr:hypothetical protein HWI79_2020 [Cryptosporidium felis]